jgi:hypothetical protein
MFRADREDGGIAVRSKPKEVYMTRLGFTFQMTVAAVVVFLSTAAPVPADLINGTFDGDGSPWEVFSTDTDTDPETGSGFYEGVARLEEDRTYVSNRSHTSIEQTFDMEPGEYTLSFDFRLFKESEGEGPDESDSFEVRLDGTEPFSILSSATGAVDNIPWTHEMVPVSLSSGDPHLLTFSLVGDNTNSFNTTVEFDNVQFGPPVPVPGAVVLGTIGLTLSGWLCRRRTC